MDPHHDYIFQWLASGGHRVVSAALPLLIGLLIVILALALPKNVWTGVRSEGKTPYPKD
jgi:hypothetical protein